MKSKHLAFALAAFCLLLAATIPASAQSWAATNIYNNWTSVTVSADGGKIAADSFLGGIYTSTDGGTNWMEDVSPDQAHWSVLASSTNGGNLVAAFFDGGIYTSTNWGLGWVPSGAAVDNWNCLTASWDGTRLAAGTSPGEIYTSHDSGATFTAPLPQNNYQAIASSAAGDNLVAIVFGGRIYRSTDQGTTWTATAAPAAEWSAITSSADGTKLAAVVQGGGIYTSADDGVSWSITDAPGTNWSSVASSSDGSQLVAAVDGGALYGGGLIYVSTDFGADWTATTAPSNHWAALSSSPDGTRLFALVNGNGEAYLSTNSGTSWNEQLLNNVPASTNAVFADSYSLSVISSNRTSHVFTTNTFATSPSLPRLAFSKSPVGITNSVGFSLTAATVSGTQTTRLITSLGLDAQGNSIFTFSPITNLLGTNSLGIGVKVPKAGHTNSVAVHLPVAGEIGAVSTNLVNVLHTNIAGIQIVISNFLNVNVTVANDPLQTWTAIAASADGSHWFAAANGGFIYSSTNSGASWKTNGAPVEFWSALASSADGTRLVATIANGGIFTSTNSGAAWTSNNAPNEQWSAVHSSPDGNTLVALARSGWSLKSTNSGAAWFSLGAPYDNWQSLASSADGTRLLAASRAGYVYLSTNAGTAWSALCIVPGVSNVLVSDTLNFSAIYTNLSKATTNNFITNFWSYPLTGFPAVTLSNNSFGIVSGLGIHFVGTTVSGTNELNVVSLLGFAVQGVNLEGFGPVVTNLFNAAALGSGKTIPSSIVTNAFATTLAVPDGTGPVNPNGVLSTNLFSVIDSTVSGIATAITNDLSVEVVVSNQMQTWSAVASSGDGSHLAAAVNGGTIYVSANFGTTWIPTDAPVTNWSALTMSADGRQLVAAVSDGPLYTSSDSGATWNASSVPAANWSAVASSANGAELVAVIDGGAIYTRQSSVQPATVPALQIQMTNGSVILSWPASSATCVLQQNSNFGSAAWQNLPTTPVIINGTNQVTVPMTSGPSLYRLMQP
jgi:photosystem II stability/assembly factor-like uncharacterized protein